MELTQANIREAFMKAGELQAAGRYEEAADLWREITRTAPRSAEAFGNYAATLQELGDLEAAEAAAREAGRLKPDAAWAQHRLGRVLHLARRFDAAEAAYRAALALDPADRQSELALGHLYLARGDFARGFPLYEARLDVPGQNAPRLPAPNMWRGEPLAGKSILIWPEQGFGDQIQFARFAPVLKAMGAEVTLAAPPELAHLFANLDVRVVPQTHALPAETGTDYWTLPLSVPRWLGTKLETLPPAPYLAAPADRRERWRGYLRPGTVGVVWQGRPTPGNTHRSLPNGDILRQLELAGAQVVDLSYPVGDFADMAAIVETLDLVVTIDTAMAHLAGALGKRAYVLLPAFRTDWRWLQDRADSPWYSSMTLFRQPARDAWEPAVQALVRAYVAEFRS